jgi:enoyl-CoA hydratase
MATVTLERVEARIALLTLDRPDRLNAMSFELVADLHDALDEISGDPECTVVVLTGAGRGFCAGLDLKDWGAPPDPGAHRPCGVRAQCRGCPELRESLHGSADRATGRGAARTQR